MNGFPGAPGPRSWVTVIGARGAPGARFRDDFDHLLAPSRPLVTKDAARNFEQGARAVQGESRAPILRDVREILVDEGGPDRARPLVRDHVEPCPADDVGEHVGGIPHRIPHGDRIEVDESHPGTRDEDVIRLEISMDRRRGSLPQIADECRRDRIGLRLELRNGPSHQRRCLADVGELVTEVVRPWNRWRVAMEVGRGPGAQPGRRHGVPTPQQDLLQGFPLRLLKHQCACLGDVAEGLDQ